MKPKVIECSKYYFWLQSCLFSPAITKSTVTWYFYYIYITFYKLSLQWH